MCGLALNILVSVVNISFSKSKTLSCTDWAENGQIWFEHPTAKLSRKPTWRVLHGVVQDVKNLVKAFKMQVGDCQLATHINYMKWMVFSLQLVIPE